MKTLVTYFSAQGHTKRIAEEFAKEIEEGAGTHYAPFMAELLAEPAVAEDIRYLLAAHLVLFQYLSNFCLSVIIGSLNTVFAIF